MTFMAQHDQERWEAAIGVAELSVEVWFDQARAFTCTEADAVARFLDTWHRPGVGDEFLILHAEGDDEGDDHFHLREDDE